MQENGSEYEVFDFGWWPEIFGAVCAALLVWFLIAFARGSL